MNRNSHPGPSATPAELRAQVEELREELGHTMEALAAKADVKSRAQQRAVLVREQMHDRAVHARGRAHDTASHMKGRRARTSRAHGGGHRPALLMKDKRVLIALAVLAAAGTVFAVGRNRYCHRRHR
ncbi:DUF3618 domain-containing protein [Streptomyces sp. TS71-3]|uniref:DUF3618 domain-containing protein n=1 Tax=Streptomyces sp. TS71-3 TaxID=2733862 RepID=UPI001B2B44C3|nr:DUF3618 domain-containing protein [Streptomyces sp. TS71-3]GHJ42537.1 hypothetical protein Sm713_81460 [Streptomyces sp. TS71-3]